MRRAYGALIVFAPVWVDATAQPAPPLSVTPWSLAPSSGHSLDLKLPPGDGVAEDILVIGRRRARRPALPPAGPVNLGPVQLEGELQTHRDDDRTGLTVTAAVPIPGFAGADAVVNFAGESGGSALRNQGAPVVSAGPPVGVRIKF